MKPSLSEKLRTTAGSRECDWAVGDELRELADEAEALEAELETARAYETFLKERLEVEEKENYKLNVAHDALEARVAELEDRLKAAQTIIIKGFT